MIERISTIGTRPFIPGLLAMILACACASAPEPKPEEVKPAEQKDAATEEITPLAEEDRPGVTKADESETTPAGEAQPPPEPVALGEEASQLLASAAQVAESDPAAARKMVEQAARENPGCFQCQYDIGVLLESEGKIADAARAYQKALSIHPIHLQSVINLSNLYVRQGDLPKARQVVAAAARAAPRELGLRNQLATVLLASRKLKEAAEQAKGVLLVDERNVPAMICLAQAYYEWGKYELAERILLKAKENDDSHAVIPNRLGFVYLKMDNLTSAIASFKKAVELDPNLPEAHNNLGVLYHRAHDYTAAIEALRRAVALAPTFVEAYLNLGNALRGGKQFKEAEEAYRKALEAGPKENRAMFNLGLLYLDDEIPGLDKVKRLKQAVDQLENFQRRGGRHPMLAEYLKEAKKKHEREVNAELRRKQREEEKRRKEEEARKKAEAEAKAKVEAEARAKAEAEAKAKEEAEARARAKAKAEAEARERARKEAEARAKAEAEAKAKAEAAAREKARREAEAKARAEREAKERARREAERKRALEGKKLGGGKDEEAPAAGTKLGGGKDDEGIEDGEVEVEDVDDEEPSGSKVGGDEK